jgi:signal transduction histidine kinase
LATLNERNRIARDIHDNVGHMLSRSILQVGALLAVNGDENTKTGLNSIKETLSEAMDSIRNSVHNLHEESIDLNMELQKIIDNFTFCPVNFEYSIENAIDRNIKYSFISIIKEALANVIKHSNATLISITIREHPAIYQLIVKDNGNKPTSKIGNGIGLKNIEDRVTSLNGNVNISSSSGFKIFISIPKN